MRIENGGIPIPPDKGNSVPDANRKKTEKSGSQARRLDDKVSISPEARDLQADRVNRSEEGSLEFGRESSDLKEIRERIDSEFYDSKQAILSVAVRVLEVFGL